MHKSSKNNCSQLRVLPNKSDSDDTENGRILDDTKRKDSMDTASFVHRIKQEFEVRYKYDVYFTREVFSEGNLLLKNCLPQHSDKATRILFAVDAGLVQANPNLTPSIVNYCKAHSDRIQLVAEPWLVPGGEACKNTQDIPEKLYHYSQEENICRHSYVVAIGGGAVIDAVGYAAATAHRGIKLIRMPTTVLGQNDAGVGVKNAINWQKRKNFIGTFVPPQAVINDFSLLNNLPRREKIAGIAEAIKVSLICDNGFFNYLHSKRFHLSELDDNTFEHMIIRCAELHLKHIREGGDPFERGSARPLDFGHWTAHKLEELTNNALKHGEAVAIGIALDTLYSSKMGLLKESEANTVIQTLSDIGLKTYHPALEKIDIHKALEEFREHLGGELCITLLKGIGERIEVNKVDIETMYACATQLRQNLGHSP